MAITDDVITATSELSVTDGVSGPVFADFIPTAVKAYVLGKLGIGTIQRAHRGGQRRHRNVHSGQQAGRQR